MELDLKKLGKHQSQMPKSLATCFDFVSIWGGEPSRNHLARLCAAAIAVAVDHANILPRYPVADGDPIGFGHKIMDRLLSAGVTPGQVYELGTQVLVEMMGQINFDGVDKTANFTPPDGAT